MQRTLIILKPDAVQRQLAGEILCRFEKKGLKITALKMLRVATETVQQHYAEHITKPFYPNLEKYITSGPVIAGILEGPEAIAVVRRMVGPTNGIEAPAGTIRGDFALSGQHNLVHASDSEASAEKEIRLFFG